MRRRTLVLFVVAACVAVLWLLCGSGPERVESVPRAIDEQRAEHEIVQTGRATAEAASAAAAPQNPGRATRELVVQPAAEPSELATIRGRCVDASGTPVAGVVARLAGLHPERPEERAPGLPQQVTTSSDGRFEVQCAPGTERMYFLTLRSDRFAGLDARWNGLQPGAKDLGDLLLHAGVRLAGRVVDPDGVAVTDVELQFEALENSWTLVQPHAKHLARSGADGTFRIADPMLPGGYYVNVRGRRLAQSRQLTLRDDEPTRYAEILVGHAEPLQTISGVVVDDSGRPVEGAGLESLGNRPSIARSEADGRVSVARREGSSDEVRLRVDCEGFELYESESYIPWGSADLRFVLRRGVDLELHVVTAGERSPVEEFSVHVVPEALAPWSREVAPRAGGKHPDGRVTLTGLRRGTQTIEVEPADPQLASSGLIPVTIGESGPARATIELPRVHTRELRVRLSDGSIPTEATVQLVDTLGQSIERHHRVLPVRRWGHGTGAQRLLLLQEVKTDPNGSAMLRGPARQSLALCLQVGQRPPTFVEQVDLAVAGPLVVELPVGAKLQLRAEPLDVLADLRVLAGMPASGTIDERQQRYLPQLRLEQGERDELRIHPPSEREPLSFDAGGVAQFTGVPAGTWRIQATIWHFAGQGGRGGREFLGEVTLRDGESKSVVVDLAHLRCGRLDARVLCDGEPFVSGHVLLESQPQARAVGGPVTHRRVALLDQDGACSIPMLQGTYSLAVQHRVGDETRMLRAPGQIVIAPGGTVSRTIDVRTRTITLKLVDHEGRPAGGIPLELRDTAGALRHLLRPTDAEGIVRCAVEAEAFELTVLPKRLYVPQQRQRVWELHKHEPDPFATYRIRLATLDPDLAEPVPQTIRLPADWFQ